MKVTEKDIGNVITTLFDSFQDELFACKESDLDKEYWHYKHDPSLPLETSIYKFYDRLKLYHGFVRRWEEHHNGSICVVERVRDKYLMPKIREFSKLVKTESGATTTETGQDTK